VRAPHHLAVVGDRVAIADNTNGRLVVLDRSTRRVVATIPVGPRPHGVAAVPAAATAPEAPQVSSSRAPTSHEMLRREAPLFQAIDSVGRTLRPATQA
jgi:YVTN family beta-propeller protein